jgi:hypothetical protein
MTPGRLASLAGLCAVVGCLFLPGAASAQSAGPFPSDQQPISDEYGLPPLDHHSHSGGAGAAGGGGGGGAGGGGGDVFASSGAAAAESLSAGDVRRGEKRAGSGRPAGGGAHRSERVGIGRPVAPPNAASADPRGGFDVLLLVLAGLAAAGLVVAGIVRLRRPERPV